jgi:inorganic pyrophosphatase
LSVSEVETVDAFIEIPRGSRNKYEFDKKLGMFRLDRVLYSSVHYPSDYGYIPDTLGEDGDPLDILVIVQEPTFPGCLIPARPIGGLDMYDEAGSDFKVVAVPAVDPRYSHIHDMDGVGEHWAREIETFFASYKHLEGKISEVRGWHDVDHVVKVIAECRERFDRTGQEPAPDIEADEN